MREPGSFALVTDNFPPGGGGVSRYYGELVAEAAAPISVYSPWASERPLAVGSGLRSRAKQSFEAERIARSSNAMMLFGQPHLAVTSAAVGRPFGMFVHGGEWSAYGSWGPKAVDLLACRAKIVFANSAATARDWLPRTSASGNVHVLRPGVPHRWLRLGRQAGMRDRISDAGPVFLAVARLDRHKRIPELVRAFLESSAAEAEDARLVVVGGGSEEAAVARLCSNHPNLRYAGRVSDHELVNLYSRADFFAHCPSIDPDRAGYEGFGIVYLEAAAFGLPVIGSASGGTEEAMAPGSAVVEMDDWGAVSREFLRLSSLSATEYEVLRTSSFEWALINSWSVRAKEFDSVLLSQQWS